ncbi:hypothetical protein [Halobaculum marinum]|uniref:DUF7988 domain-containing protein n=1 Tax=Halobaculum marinum TaxID=3031996 RepID=A0ABD5WU91_9EURY|nr:hypothetical protein [Halobaculum sp. DT55]
MREDTTDQSATVRERLVTEHAPLLDAVDACADAVAARWEDGASEGTTDRDAVVSPLRDALSTAGVHERLPGLLTTAAAALGASLPARPVAAPPYLVVTATGPVVRATLPEVGRLVVSLNVFVVDREGDTPRYRRADAAAEESLTVELR